ncbi:hypothetical protein OIU77_013374 [Salix suchowensis]|uniref:Uncharacterized protein n=1 Tax=Salix suchowensis TaxID=1278906 RepID=A0ABQ8ZTU5_9ROSI|nr:hypothetical protein OIU77_013374 [Salix suchowensis]KAJ6311605.1 hypothetical protein OIU77_013374 [Salix suchowensis]
MANCIFVRSYILLGGGIPESRRANELSELLGVLQGHSSFKSLLKRYENQLIVATGKGEPAVVMSEYGFKKAVSLEDHMYLTKHCPGLMNDIRLKLPAELGFNGFSAQLWKPGILYRLISLFDIQAAFPSNRLGTGAFRIALESVFNRIHYNPLDHLIIVIISKEPGDSGSQSFKTLYMIGDNPSVDVKGAQQAGHPWFSILTRTGVFRGKHNHAEFPADLVVDTVEEAVDYILGRECIS